jgi:hypothetical protein
MQRQLAALLVSGAFMLAGSAAIAHHSFAMFDSDNPLTFKGKVTDFKFTSPHTFILLEVKGADGQGVVWNLEGGSPSALVRDGWNSKTLKAGDELEMKINPLRSGAPGGAWNPKDTKKTDGTPIVAKVCR